MTDETQALGPQEPSLDDVLAECIAAEEAGGALDRSALVARYPQHAADLREFFANRDRMQRLAGPLRGGASGNGHPQIGAKLRYFGDYELLEEIAVGGMGIVYKARQVSLNRIVAVKMILKGTLASEDDVKRFRAEAEAAASLQHPGIVAIHEVGLHEGQHYFSMDFVDGQSLAQLPREQPLPASQAAEYVRDAAEAVHYAHQQGTLHRDLKPSNILIDRQGRVRITDFGLAKRIEGQSDLTLSGQILGTPSYMPPEQALSKRSLIGTASDVYSLGAVLYELLAGRPPFRGESPAETLRQVESLDPISPRLLSPTVPRDLETICLKCLEKEPHKRYATAQHLADDLGRFLRHEPILARPISRLGRTWRWCRRHPSVAVLTAATVLSLVMGATVSTLFGIEANVRAAGERSERIRANSREAEAIAARARAQELKTLAEQKSADLGRANQTLEAQAGRLGQQATELRTRQVSLYRSLLKLAHAQAQGNEIALADENLNTFPPEFRGWAWRYAKRLCHPEFVSVAGSRCAAFAPSGDAVATAIGTEISVHAMPRGDKLITLRGHSGAVTAIGFIGTRDLLVSASDDGTVRAWNAATGAQLSQQACGSACRDLAIAPDGRHVAIASDGGKARIWDREANRVVRELTQPSTRVLSVAYSPDGTLLATGHDHKPGVRLWNTATWEEDERSQSGALTKTVMNFFVAVEGLVQTGVQDLAFSPDGATLAIAQGDSLSLLDLTTLDVRRNLSGHFGGVLATEFSPDGRRVASASSDGNVRIWDVADGRCLRTLPWHSGAVNAVEFCANQPWLASVDGGSLRVWDLSPDWDVRRFAHHTDAAYGVAFDMTGKLLATGGGRNAGVGVGPLDGEVRIINVESGGLVFSAAVPETVTAKSARTPAVLSVALSPDAAQVAAAGRSLHVHIFDVATEELVLRIEDVGGQIGVGSPGTELEFAL